MFPVPLSVSRLGSTVTVNSDSEGRKDNEDMCCVLLSPCLLLLKFQVQQLHRYVVIYKLSKPGNVPQKKVSISPSGDFNNPAPLTEKPHPHCHCYLSFFLLCDYNIQTKS